jgi:tetratricopeptide (TPR) repeat protein
MKDRIRRDVTREKAAEAQRLFRMAYARQLEGDIERALVLYEKSIRLHATAEAHAYLGWAKSTRGQIGDAIDHCVEAIRLDPDFPNAWNDIGAYLIEQGRADDALFFLKRATRMKSHPSRCFPHYNLHRAYLALGDRPRAITEVQAALEADPEFSPAQDALMSLLFPGREERPRFPEAALAGTPVLAFPPKS